MSSTDDRNAAADALRTARRSRAAVTPFTDTDETLDGAWGYAVQAVDRDRRVAAGERLVGAKLGLTSEAKQQRMGVDQPIVGFLTDAMVLSPEDVPAALTGWIQPRIEPEIAFVTSRAIDRVLDLETVAQVVGGVTVAAEIIDSRFVDYRFRLPDVVADNTSAAGLLLGPARQVPDLADLVQVACRVDVGGDTVHKATGAAILGNPLKSLVFLSEHLAARGEVLPEGSIVLAGALTDAVPLLPEVDYRLEIDTLGAIDISSGQAG